MNPVRAYTIILGVALLVAGLVGFSSGRLLGSNINFVFNMLHFISGIIGIAAASHSKLWAKIYDKIIGIFYGIIGISGFVIGLFFGSAGSVNILHIAVSITALAYGYDGEESTVQILPRRAATKSEFEQRAEELRKKAEEEERRRRAA